MSVYFLGTLHSTRFYRNFFLCLKDGGAGTKGTVKKRHVDAKEDKAGHCWYAVKWQGKESTNLYRVGLGGFIDLKAVTSSTGYYIYPDHLPNFGKDISSFMDDNQVP